MCVCVCVISHLVLSDSLGPRGLQPGMSMGFSRQAYWSWLSFPPPGDLLDSRLLGEKKPHFSALSTMLAEISCEGSISSRDNSILRLLSGLFCF